MERVPLKGSRSRDVRVPVGVAGSPVGRIIREFCERFAPGARLVYAGGGWGYLYAEALESLGVSSFPRPALPDVVVYDAVRTRLLLVEAAMGVEQVGAGRRGDLEALFGGRVAELAFISAFPDRDALAAGLGDIPWGTAAWLAEDPDHLIHFDGKRLAGPYWRAGAGSPI
jgi:hypothetical protein